MSGLSDIIRVLGLIEIARDKSKNEGKYTEAIKDYEQILKFSVRTSAVVEEKIGRKFEELRLKLQVELKILYDLQRELSLIMNGCTNNNDLNSQQVVDDNNTDPDVWPPPTPVSGKRRPENSNVPAWAKIKENDVDYKKVNQSNNALININQSKKMPFNRNPPFQGRAVSSNNNVANNVDDSGLSRIEKLRRERDAATKIDNNNKIDNNIPANRRRNTSSAQQLPSRKPTLNNGNNNNNPVDRYKNAGQPLKSNANNANNKIKKNVNGEKPKFSELAKEEGWVDLELIEGIERDIVEGKLSVTWDNIAGLSEVKNLLQEAVVLPLWMPQYFKGFFVFKFFLFCIINFIRFIKYIMCEYMYFYIKL
jgi:hypothetical protein